jgi:hypothetical protein
MPHRLYDEELWEFFTRVQGNNLINVTEEALQWRLAAIDRNILFLDGPETPRDDLPPERGWLSPWWWWRMRHWTLKEFQRRGLSVTSTVNISAPVPLRPEFHGSISGGGLLLVRISRRDWILDTLTKGRLRFSPAALYSDAKLDAARADEEMAKSYHRPGSQLTITDSRGKEMLAIGDAIFTTRRAIEHGSDFVDVPYWLCSFSSDLDPRLFTEFPDLEGAESACLVIFDVMEFVSRARPKLNLAAPFATKQLLSNEYYDPYHRPPEAISPVQHKHFSYGYQREMRFLVDPEGRPLSKSAPEGPFFIDVGSIEDIAAAYNPAGGLILGSGPESFLA